MILRIVATRFVSCGFSGLTGERLRSARGAEPTGRREAGNDGEAAAEATSRAGTVSAWPGFPVARGGTRESRHWFTKRDSTPSGKLTRSWCSGVPALEVAVERWSWRVRWRAVGDAEPREGCRAALEISRQGAKACVSGRPENE
jgi:hypothetical protein